VLVQRAHGSAPLSHLFSQGLVAAQALFFAPEARARFASAVRVRQGPGHPRGLRAEEDRVRDPAQGRGTTPDTLFPFSQVTLASTARILEARGIAVEVIGITAAAG
jgi:uncharacterized protein (TIGR04141 family)